MKDKDSQIAKESDIKVYIVSKNTQFKCFLRSAREGFHFPCFTEARRLDGKRNNFRRKTGKLVVSLSAAMVFDDFVVNLKYAM